MLAACNDNSGGNGGGHDMSAPPSDLSIVFHEPDLACGNQLVGGPFTSFAVGTATFFRCARLFIVRDELGIYAMTSICTHQMCDVAADRNSLSFTCPCHMSQYDANGNVTHGPAMMPLVHFLTMLDRAGNVSVDVGTTVDESVRLTLPDS
jgi:Rieske Fe-S protein